MKIPALFYKQRLQRYQKSFMKNSQRTSTSTNKRNAVKCKSFLLFSPDTEKENLKKIVNFNVTFTQSLSLICIL